MFFSTLGLKQGSVFDNYKKIEMKENKIYIDRKLPSEEAINKHKDFEALLAAYEVQKTSEKQRNTQKSGTKAPVKKLYYYIAGVAACLILGFALIYPAMDQKSETANQEVATNSSDTKSHEPIVPSEEKEKGAVVKPEKTPSTNPKPEEKGVSDKKTPDNRKESEKLVVSDEKQIEQPVTKPQSSEIMEPQKPKRKPIQLKLENESLHPELMAYKNHQWEYAGDTDTQDPWKNNVFGKDNHWDNASVKKMEGNHQYEITLSRKDGTTFVFPARVVFSGKAYEEAMKTYEELKNKQTP